MLTHDDGRDIRGRVDREQDVVPEKLDRDDRSDAVTALAVRNQRRHKLFGPKRERRWTVAERRLHGHAAQRALRYSGRDDAR